MEDHPQRPVSKFSYFPCFSLLFFVGLLSILLMIGDVFLLLQTSFSWILAWGVGCCLYLMQTSFFLNSPYTGYKRSKNAGNITQQSFGEPLDLSRKLAVKKPSIWAWIQWVTQSVVAWPVCNCKFVKDRIWVGQVYVGAGSTRTKFDLLTSLRARTQSCTCWQYMGRDAGLSYLTILISGRAGAWPICFGRWPIRAYSSQLELSMVIARQNWNWIQSFWTGQGPSCMLPFLVSILVPCLVWCRLGPQCEHWTGEPF